MVEKIRTSIMIPNYIEGDAAALKGDLLTPGTGVAIGERFGAVIRRTRLVLTSFLVNDVSTSDFGGTSLLTFANTNLLILGAYLSCAVTIAGMTTQACTSLIAAIGTVTTASTTFANAGEKNIIASMTGVGAGATGTIGGALGSNVTIAAGASNQLFLNIAQPVTSGTGTATFTGRLDLVYADLGVG